uniref:Uncharacterized protein n=1 Tax=Anguilla anguilla TaxID=7936 RepID=A0A0E9XPM3_ANGAN
MVLARKGTTGKVISLDGYRLRTFMHARVICSCYQVVRYIFPRVAIKRMLAIIT